MSGSRSFAAAGDLSERRIDRTAFVAVDPDVVFDAWTTAEGIRAWFVDACHVGFRIGGPFELYFLTDGPEGERGSEGCTFLSFDPGRMVSFSWHAPPHLERTRRALTWVCVTLEPVTGGTRVHLSHLGWPAAAWDQDAQWPATYAYFEDAWSQVLSALQAHFGAIPPA